MIWKNLNKIKFQSSKTVKVPVLKTLKLSMAEKVRNSHTVNHTFSKYSQVTLPTKGVSRLTVPSITEEGPNQ